MKMTGIMGGMGFLLLISAGIAIPGYGGAIAADHTRSSLEQEVGGDRIVLINDLEKIDYSPFLVYLNQSSRSPEEYILSKYGDHDIVILGEAHEVRENCELISGLIKILYHKAGVGYFATEFLRSKNNPLVNQLVTGEEYDHELELRICRDYAWPIWGFKEYMKIFESVWELNKSLPADAEKIKVVGLDSEWDAYDALFGSTNVDVNQFWLEREKHMTDILGKEVLEKEGKALVHMGYAHTLPSRNIRPTLGNWIRERYKNKAFQICLHHDHQGPTGKTAMIPLIEKIMEKNNNKPVGFDVQNSPFSPLRDQSSIYFSLVDDIAFSDIAQGYVFMKPVKDLRKVTWVHGFIGESNFEKTRAIALKRGWIGEDECMTPEEMDNKMAEIFSER
jgi:hypothetical protein